MFAPSGLGIKSGISMSKSSGNISSTYFATSNALVTPFGQGYLLVRSRQRITFDGGHSLLAVPAEAKHARPVFRITGPTSADDKEEMQPQEHHGLFETIMELADSTRIEEVESNRAESSEFETCAEESGSEYQLHGQTDRDAFNGIVPDHLRDESMTEIGQSFSFVESYRHRTYPLGTLTA